MSLGNQRLSISNMNMAALQLWNGETMFKSGVEIEIAKLIEGTKSHILSSLIHARGQNHAWSRSDLERISMQYDDLLDTQ